MTRVERTMARAVVALVVVLAAAGCGVRADDGPRPLDVSGVPPELLDETPPTTIGQGDERAEIYLLDLEDRLVRRERPVPARRVNLVLRALTQRLSPDEAADQLGSEIPPDTRLEVEGPDADRVVRVNVDLPEDETFAGKRQRLAVAQIVYTATAVPGVEQVRFEFDGRASDIPDERGETISGPIGREDFDELAPVPG